jgi:hypothetical protein
MKTQVLILLSFVCLGIDAQKGNQVPVAWHISEKINASDYQVIKKSNLSYYLSNDNENFYIDLKIEDAGVQNKILKEGLTIWIDMDDKSAKKMGIRFPIGSQNKSGRTNSLSESMLNSDGTLITPLSQANTIELIGFNSEETRRFPSENTDNIRGSVKYDNEGILYYKMVLPFAKLPLRNSKQGDGAMPFAIGLEYGILSSVNKSGNKLNPTEYSSSISQGSRSGSQGGRGSGGGPPAGRGGAMPASARGTNQNLYTPNGEAVLKWIKDIRLATSK